MINFKNSLFEKINHNGSSKLFFNYNDDNNKGNLSNDLPLINIFNEFYPEEIIHIEKDLFVTNDENSKDEDKFKINNNINNFEESDDSSIILIRKNLNDDLKKYEIMDMPVLNYNKINIFHNQREEKFNNQIELNEEEEENYQIKENKKIVFNVFNLFNPPGETIELKKIRKEINEIIISGKKEEIKKDRKRKLKPDDVRKKIKARFLKSLKNRINEKLINAKSEEIFDFLPQCFICNITKKENDKNILNMTFKELFSTDFFEKYKNKIKIDKKLLNNKRKFICPDKKKYLNNIKVIKYLDKNSETSKKSNYDIVKNMSFSDLFKEYIKSKEFEVDILKLKKEGNEDQDYINNYIIKANDFIDFFSKSG